MKSVIIALCFLLTNILMAQETKTEKPSSSQDSIKKNELKES
jgi:hypothetical protein